MVAGSIPAGPTLGVRCNASTRGAQVHNALARIPAHDDERIVVHDAVRPCVNADTPLRLQRELASDDVGGLLALPVADRLKRVGDDTRVIGTEARDGVWHVQTPQMLRYGVLRDRFALPEHGGSTDKPQAVEASGRTARVILLPVVERP